MIAGEDLKALRQDICPGTEHTKSASLELKVGKIYSPPIGEDQEVKDYQSYSLKVGGTVVVETLEEITMPTSKAGLMFPKSSALAEQGILITNFGLVDPGYSGKLRYAIINLGSSDYFLKKGAVFVHLTVFDLGRHVEPFKGGDKLSAEVTARRLGRDFVNVSERAEQVAKKHIQESVFSISVVLALVLIVPSIFLALAPPFLDRWWGYSGGITEQLTESNATVTELQSQIGALEERVACLVEGTDPNGC
ncbi:MAG: hypothetical protein AAF718_14635 [Pseudomonadota bacterium]